MKWRDIPLGYKDRIEVVRTLLEKDPFLVLEIHPSATIEEIKGAYRKKMSTYHPDGQDAFLRDFSQEMTKLINVAYDNILREKK